MVTADTTKERGLPLRVLWLEDSEDDVYFVKSALKRSGLPIILDHSWNGQEGLSALFREDLPAPDVILTDIRMPRMDGLAFAGEVRRHGRFDAIPIFVLSTSGLPRDVQAGQSFGIAGHFTKPATPQEWVNQLLVIYDAMVRHLAAERCGSLVTQAPAAGAAQ